MDRLRNITLKIKITIINNNNMLFRAEKVTV